MDLDLFVDEFHRSALAALPPDFMDLSSISTARERILGVLDAARQESLPEAIAIDDVWVPGLSDGPDVRVKVYRPQCISRGVGALYWIHGGGRVMHSADIDDLRCAMRAVSHGCVVVSVDYRLAPEHRAPSQVDDCYAGLQWLDEQSSTLGVDRHRLVIGSSAGGALAAGTALRARDHGGPAVAAQLLAAPMIDHRNETDSSYAIVDRRVWNREASFAAWRAYLGADTPTIYTSPAIAEDLSELPRTYISVGSLDMFLEEDVAYAQRLMASGVPTDLHVYAGAFHGSTRLVPQSPLSKRWTAGEEAFLTELLSENGVVI